MQANDPHWYSRVKAARQAPTDRRVQWDDEAEVVVIGLGGAGVCAALEALQNGAKVIAIDRFTGGGATRMSGGVFYSGGGTRFQKEAGIEDNVEEMYKYLKLEVADAVSDETLRDFCETSNANIEWLSSHGVPFAGAVSPIKTSYPSYEYSLYYSGNEPQADYADHAKPAQRGHRTCGVGLTGHILFDALLAAAMKKGLKLYSFSEARGFIMSGDGELEGIEIQHVDPATNSAKVLAKISQQFAQPATMMMPGAMEKLVARANAITDGVGQTRTIKIRKAAVLATGGYIHNRKMVQHYAPKYSGAVPLGSIGCDGSGIRLAQTMGAKVDRLDNISAWRQFNPPSALACGIVVNGKGERVISEDHYGGTIGHAIGEHHGGVGYVILDKPLRDRAFMQALPGKGKLFQLQGAPALLALMLSTKKGSTLEALADKCGMDSAKLRAAVDHYNRSVAGLEPTKFRKSKEFTAQLLKGPFYAMDISIHSRKFICPSISLGGVVVDEKTGQALNEQNQPIKKLFVAGKTAKGISSHRYVSGISLADAVYSGRVAGRAASR